MKQFYYALAVLTVWVIILILVGEARLFSFQMRADLNRIERRLDVLEDQR